MSISDQKKNEDATEFAWRLKQLIDKLGLSQMAFAREIGVPQPSVSAYINGKNIPKIDFLIALKRRFEQVNLEWLICGKGSMFIGQMPPEALSTVHCQIPVVTRVAAGQLVQHWVAEHPDEWLILAPESLGAAPNDQLFGLRVSGDSMEPWMYPGDIVVCSAVRSVHPGCDVVYYSYLTGESTIKRLVMLDRPGRRLKLAPLNPTHELIEVHLEPHDQIYRVVALIRRMKSENDLLFYRKLSGNP